MVDTEIAAALFEARGVPHGANNPLTPFEIAVLAFRDLDNIPVDLITPLGS